MASIAQFSGLASGIDSASLIDALVAARQKTNDIRKKDIEFLQSENEALDELNTKILAFNDLIDRFRTANGGGVSKKSSSSDATVATASVGASANNATVRVTTTSVASAATASFNDAYADGDALFASHAVGTQTIGVDIGTGADLVSIDVDVTNTTTVQQYVDAFNANANAAGRASASIINVGTSASPSYRVVITSEETGTGKGTITFDVPTAGAGFGGNSDLQNRTTDQATDAVFSISGISGSITRSTNSVGDVLTGVTLNLAKAGTADLTIGDDADTTADLFQEIVDSFNDIVSYVNENNTSTQDQNSKDKEIVYGTLAKTKVDDELLQQIRDTLLSATAANGTTVTSASEMGISTNRDGTLTFDADKFRTAVGEDALGVGQVLTSFADSTAGVAGFLYQYTTFDGFIDNAQSSNNDQIDRLNEAIAQLDRSTDKMKERLQLQFSRLESVTAQLQSTQQQLTSILSGLK